MFCLKSKRGITHNDRSGNDDYLLLLRAGNLLGGRTSERARGVSSSPSNQALPANALHVRLQVGQLLAASQQLGTLWDDDGTHMLSPSQN